MKAIPTIQRYMTTCPQTIGSEQSLARAKALMRELDIRHLPVLHGGRLVGVLTDRDVKLLESVAAEPAALHVEDAMTDEPYQVPPDRSLDEVVTTMAERKLGSALVVQNEKIVGVFTTTDVCRALAELLHTRLRP